MDRGDIDWIVDDWDCPIKADFSAEDTQRIVNAAIADLSGLRTPELAAAPATAAAPAITSHDIDPHRPSALGALIRIGVVFSIAFHAALFISAFVRLDTIEPLEAGAEAGLSVDIVQTSSVSANSTANIQSDAVEDLVSAGAEAVEAVEAETLEPTEVAEAEPVETIDPVEPTEMAETVEDVPPEAPTPAQVEPQAASTPSMQAAETVVPTSAEQVLRAEPIDTAMQTSSIAPQAAETVTEATSAAPTEVQAAEAIAAEAVEVETPPETITQTAEIIEVEPEGPVAPIPATRTVAQRTEPTYPTRPRRQQQQQPPREAPREQVAEQPQRQPRRQAQPAGNGGNAQADVTAGRAAAAAAGGGGSNAGMEAKYEGQVRRRVQKAIRVSRSTHRGPDAIVRFTIAASGAASNIFLARSSGDSAMDAAAVATVQRASPFPPIPPELGISSKTLDMPLGSVR